MFFSLRNRLFIIFMCLLTIPFLILSIIIPSWFTSFIKEQTQDLTIEMMDQYSLYVDSITTQAQDLGKQVLVNQTTQEWLKLKTENVSNEDRLFVTDQLRMQLTSMMINNSNAMSISVFHSDGTGPWGNNPTLNEEDWYKDFVEHDQRFVNSHLDSYQQNHEMRIREINSYILPLFDTNTLITKGVIKVNFPTPLLEEALTKITIGEEGRAYLIDQQGANVLQGQIDTPEVVLEKSLTEIKKENQGKGLIEVDHDGETYFVFFQNLPVGDWILISEVIESDLFSRANSIQRNLMLTSGAVFLLTIVASFTLSSTITRPLGKLAKAMGFIERGDFTGAERFMPTIQSHHNEVGYLVKVFDRTVGQLKHLIETQYEANLRRKDAEYKALLLQINPHFLNNTLEIIGGLAVQGKNKEVMNVSVYLGRMMRYSLNTETNIVHLSEEINYIRSYTDILKLRYEDTISIEIDEDPTTKTLPVIKFILQPLVENAVKYSFIEKNEASVCIKTEKVGNQVFIVVEDKGIGMPEDRMNHLENHDEHDEKMTVLESKGNSIGLKNVLGRLKLYYGEGFSYQIESVKNEGTKITLCINSTRGDRDDEGRNYG